MTDGGEIVFKGLPASPGIAIGIIDSSFLNKDTKTHVTENFTPSEHWTRFDQALTSQVSEYEGLLSSAENSEVTDIFQTYIAMLSDPELKNAVRIQIEKGNTAEDALVGVVDTQKEFLQNSIEQVFKERAEDFESIKQGLLSRLDGQNSNFKIGNNIYIFDQISAPLVFKLKDTGIKGIISLSGGITSHASIIARSFGIPLVVGVTQQTVRETIGALPAETEAIVDGFSGKLTLNPTSDTINKYRKKDRDLKLDSGWRQKLVSRDTVTRDGDEISLNINADFVDIVHQAVNLRADGIGLVRSEHMLLQRRVLPDEEEQYNWYREIAEAAYPLPVIIRLFDFGSDKYGHILGLEEPNPALGLRGIRYLLDDHYQKLQHDNNLSVLSTQIRAILRASNLKNISIMVPFVIKVSEVQKVRELTGEIAASLDGITIDNSIQIGTMIETPAAAIMADRLAEVSDFFSIGSNDLAQYVLAADRLNPEMSRYYRWLDTSLLKLIIQVIDAARVNKTPVSICGEVAGNPNAIPLLLWAGIDSFSVNSAVFLEVKNAVTSYSQSSFNQVIEGLIQKNDDVDLIALIEEFISKKSNMGHK